MGGDGAGGDNQTAADVPVSPTIESADDVQQLLTLWDTTKANASEVSLITLCPDGPEDGVDSCTTAGDICRDVNATPDGYWFCQTPGSPAGSTWAPFTQHTIIVELDETSWTSGDCIGFAGELPFEACDQPGTELAIPTAMHVFGLSVVHRGVTRGATDICTVELLEKAPGTTGAGTAVTSAFLHYGDADSNAPGEVGENATAFNEPIAAGGSIQLKISNYSTNTCTTLNGAIVLTVRNG